LLELILLPLLKLLTTSYRTG